MATMLEIANGISQVLASAYDGGQDSEGNPITIGLKREEGHPIHDSRVMDGFSACIKGDSLKIRYHTEVKLKEVHNSNFESDSRFDLSNISFKGTFPKTVIRPIPIKKNIAAIKKSQKIMLLFLNRKAFTNNKIVGPIKTIMN